MSSKLELLESLYYVMTEAVTNSDGTNKPENEYDLSEDFIKDQRKVKMKYKVIAYYDDVYPNVLLETDSLEEAKTECQKAHELYNIVSIFDSNEMVDEGC